MHLYYLEMTEGSVSAQLFTLSLTNITKRDAVNVRPFSDINDKVLPIHQAMFHSVNVQRTK